MLIHLHLFVDAAHLSVGWIMSQRIQRLQLNNRLI